MDGNLDRRRVLKVISAGTVVAVSIVLPSKWMRPIVHAVVVPAHAAASAPKGVGKGKGGGGGGVPTTAKGTTPAGTTPAGTTPAGTTPMPTTSPSG